MHFTALIASPARICIGVVTAFNGRSLFYLDMTEDGSVITALITVCRQQSRAINSAVHGVI